MRKIREVLRLKHDCGLTQRQIARSCHLSHPTVGHYLERAEQAGLGWPVPADLDDDALYLRLFPESAPPGTPARPLPDWSTVHRDLRRKGVTLQLVWEEYRADHPAGYAYTQFCRYYHAWTDALPVALRQIHPAGERTFVDWAGPTIALRRGHPSQPVAAYLFIAVLAASNYTFVEAFPSQQLCHWIEGHVHAFESFQGVTRLVVLDNTRTGVDLPCRYEPGLNRTYDGLLQHYGTVGLPARPHRARDKGKGEAAVQNVERRILARLRHLTFYTVAQINDAVRPLLVELNDRPFQKLAGSRRQLWEQLERPALRPLPVDPYELDEWHPAKANIDYHVQVDHNFYSVPYPLVHQRVEVRLTGHSVEVFRKGKRVAAHGRCWQRGQYITDPAHRPKAHARHLEWTPSRLIAWASQEVGPQCGTVVRALLECKPHPEQGYRSCLGILRLGRRHGQARTEAAALRALALNSPSYRTMDTILRNGTERQPLPGTAPRRKPPTPTHANLRGGDYYRPAPTTDYPPGRPAQAEPAP